MHTQARPGPNDEGETLLELLIAVAIMGIAVVAIVGGIATSILMSDIHRKQATAGAYVRNYAEAVVAYVAAGGFDPSAPFDYSRAAVTFPNLPGGFNDPTASVLCWDGIQFSNCPTSVAADKSVQQVSLTIASSDKRASETLIVIVRKP